MRQKTKNDLNQGSNAKKFFWGVFVPKYPTQMGSLSAKNASKKFSRLDTFNWIVYSIGSCLATVIQYLFRVSYRTPLFASILIP
jgi:hypothetical protein